MLRVFRTRVARMRILRILISDIACQSGPSGGIMHPDVLSRAATKQRRCALSDTLSARVLLGGGEIPSDRFIVEY